jgi:hypothetical protein
MRSKALAVLPDLPIVPVATETNVITAFRSALEAEKDADYKRFIAGILLMEYRENMIVSHRGTTAWESKAKEEDTKFRLWLKTNDLPKTTVYRWMNAAESICRRKMQIGTATDFRSIVDIEGIATSISQVMLLPDAELTEAAKTWRQEMFDFLADSTISEAVSASMAGDSPAHRITRAAAGKQHGGSHGEDRKAFQVFAARKWRSIVNDLSHWDAMSVPARDDWWTEMERHAEKLPPAVIAGMADRFGKLRKRL